MKILLIAALVVICVFMFWLAHKSGQWQSWMVHAANNAPVGSKILMFITAVSCLGFWWFTSRR